MRSLEELCIFSLLLHGISATRHLGISRAEPSDIACPISQSKLNLDISRFMGHWYILEYQYPREMALTDLSCLSFRFSESEDGIVGNFSFRFPPRFGHFYHIPTLSNILAAGQDGLWMTQFKGVSLLTAIVDTNYSTWAVFVQCVTEDGENKFMSTRVMSRGTDLSPQDWLAVREVIKSSNLEAEFKYEIDQSQCNGGPASMG